MTNSTIQTACLLVVFTTAPLAAQERLAPDVSPAPLSIDAANPADPQTFAEEISPATFGMAVNPTADGRLTISQVMDGSAAAEAGLIKGDVIVSIDEQFITQADQLHEYIAAHPTSPIRIVVVRNGTQQTIVVHALRDTSGDVDRQPASTVEARPALGVRFLQGTQVILAETLAGSPAKQAGLQVGDQLIAVNGDVIASSDHFITLVAATPFDEMLNITYVRGSERNTVAVSPAAWNTVFGASGTHVTLRPDLTDVETAVTAPVTCVAAPYYYAPAYYVSNVSPVIVPLTAYPTRAYGYSYWNYPYYSYPYYSHYGYSYGPYHYYAWPYGPPHGGPNPGRPGPQIKSKTDSARLLTPNDTLQIEQASLPLEVVD